MPVIGELLIVVPLVNGPARVRKIDLIPDIHLRCGPATR